MTKNKKAECKSFSAPHTTRVFPYGRLELLNCADTTIGRALFEPGWRWSESVKPLAKTNSCQAPHFQYHVRGIMHVLMDDGTEFDCKPGDISFLPAGHDAWTVGDETVEVIDFQGMLEYAKEQQQQAELSLHRLIMESPLPMLVLTDKKDIPLQPNQRFEDQLGYTQRDLPNIDHWWQLAFPDASTREEKIAEWFRKAEKSSLAQQQVTPMEARIYLKTGELREFDIHLTKTGQQTIAVFVDTTARRELQEELIYAARHDQLTGLLNRRGYDEELHRAWTQSLRHKTPLSLLMIDIDNFKSFNDIYGHNKGDECLQEVARLFKEKLKRETDILARFGGEEIAVVLANTSKENAFAIAEQLRLALEELNIPHRGSDNKKIVTVSIGIASVIADTSRVMTQLMMEADKLLYLAKEQGRNRVCG